MFAVILALNTSKHQLRRALAGVIFCPSRALGLFGGEKGLPRWSWRAFGWLQEGSEARKK